ncbi:hypothetical protein BCR37DRAFT_376438 [Protomyces lactucae-debilis]|uniref:Uncharacterized protein n=1 Tax=Protomyces lactucae-debilis TaxID=2754530 RepID=A0A1Y2FUV9_PROLT|nr:uncharacterized protein BCR37DRAFT_376438 [Protomyces lactucae-debilis]ORY87074.1 hypothetical protein BCR37DRAFT_376438 [Protomyces lactucae-debilis]
MLFSRWRPQEGLWEQRNIKHYDLATQAAEDRLLMQSAQAPAMRQMRYPAVLDHGSPYNTRVDQKVDNSHVKVKQRNQVAQAGAEVTV